VFAALIAGPTSCGDGESRVVSGGSGSYIKCCTPSDEVASSVSYSIDGGIHNDAIKVHPLAMSPFDLSMQASDPDLNGTFLPLKSNWVEIQVVFREVATR
jgi:hypothetical protein